MCSPSCRMIKHPRRGWKLRVHHQVFVSSTCGLLCHTIKPTNFQPYAQRERLLSRVGQIQHIAPVKPSRTLRTQACNASQTQPISVSGHKPRGTRRVRMKHQLAMCNQSGVANNADKYGIAGTQSQLADYVAREETLPTPHPHIGQLDPEDPSSTSTIARLRTRIRVLLSTWCIICTHRSKPHFWCMMRHNQHIKVPIVPQQGAYLRDETAVM